MKIVLFSNSEESALSVIRILGPARQLGIEIILGIDNGKINVSCIQECDFIIIQRDFARDLKAYELIINTAHKSGKNVVLDLDDNLLELPESHPDRISGYYTDALLPILLAIYEVDFVTVATPVLYNLIQNFNLNVKTIPNFLNDNYWSFRDPEELKVETNKITIGYMGGDSHKPDIQMVSELLQKVINENEKEIRLSFWGIDPPNELKQYSKIDWVPPRSNSYLDFAKFMQTQKADIVISPLCENFFNTCKSPIKFFEYSALGLPGIFSNIEPYSNVIVNGENGFLASNIQEWEKYLLCLINEANLRKDMAQKAQNSIQKNYLLSKNLSVYENTYNEFLSPRVPKIKKNPEVERIIKSISKQIFDQQSKNNSEISESKKNIVELSKKIIELEETFQSTINLKNDQIEKLNKKIIYLENEKEIILENKEKIIFELTNRIDEKINFINEITSNLISKEEEILNYATSFSWTITRPIRKILNRIKKNQS